MHRPIDAVYAVTSKPKKSFGTNNVIESIVFRVPNLFNVLTS